MTSITRVITSAHYRCTKGIAALAESPETAHPFLLSLMNVLKQTIFEDVGGRIPFPMSAGSIPPGAKR